LVEEEKQVLSQATVTGTDNEDTDMIDTCKIKSDPVLHATASLDHINDEDITDQVSQFDPAEFKKL
jgi:hypothetical protein